MWKLSFFLPPPPPLSYSYKIISPKKPWTIWILKNEYFGRKWVFVDKKKKQLLNHKRIYLKRLLEKGLKKFFWNLPSYSCNISTFIYTEYRYSYIKRKLSLWILPSFMFGYSFSFWTNKTIHFFHISIQILYTFFSYISFQNLLLL